MDDGACEETCAPRPGATAFDACRDEGAQSPQASAMDILGILVILLLGAGIGRFLASDGTARGLDAFAAGFLPYRAPGWPRGVQEGEPIPWKWSAMSDRSVPAVEREPAPGAGAEIFEIDPTAGAELTEVGSGHVGGGTSIRPH